jgi:hypothetical protein
MMRCVIRGVLSYLLLAAASMTCGSASATGVWESEFEAGVRARASGSVRESIDDLACIIRERDDVPPNSDAEILPERWYTGSSRKR